MRSSEAAVEHADGRIVLVRDASVISYGAQADAVVTTARRAADADASDQVLVVFEKKNYALEKTGGWDTLGMRGTCSAGFSLKAVGVADQILPVPYGVIHSPDHGADLAPDVGRQLGRHRRRRGGPGQEIHAQGAARRRACRRACRISPRRWPTCARLRALIAATLNRYEAIAHDPKALAAIDFQTAINLLKVDASEMAVQTVMNAMRATGLSGYRNDTDVSIGRALRDILSSPIMINNDRILSSLTGLDHPVRHSHLHPGLTHEHRHADRAFLLRPSFRAGSSASAGVAAVQAVGRGRRLWPHRRL